MRINIYLRAPQIFLRRFFHRSLQPEIREKPAVEVNFGSDARPITISIFSFSVLNRNEKKNLHFS